MTSLNLSPQKQYPLSVVLTSSGMDIATPGGSFELGVTIHNIGDRSAIVYIFIEERTPALRPWFRSMQERLALAPDQSGEVTFKADIPTDILPEVLEYDLVVDGSDAYQDFPPRRYDHYQLQILPAARTIGGADEPNFYLEPASSSRQPLIVQSGVSQPLQVWIDNRAERVDRFRLSCLGLPQDWRIDIIYPRDPQGFGLIVEADSLGLNPGDRGQVLVTITPPLNVLAGIYVPTLRLLSENQPDLNLLDLVYLQVNPTYQIQAILQILRSQVYTQPALFEIQLINGGNTPRNLLLIVEDLDPADSCLYTLGAAQVTLSPQTTQRILLEGLPQKRRWRRPFFGAGRFFNFRVLLEDADGYPLTNTTNPLTGNLIWLPRPWWQLLLLVLVALGLLGLLLWLLWWLFLRPPVVPQLAAFEAEDSRYAQANGEFARVSWRVDQIQQVKALTLRGVSPEGEVLSPPLTYTFEPGQLPQALRPFCTQQQQELTCTNVLTNASKPGDYIFELTVIPRGRAPRQPITLRSSRVVIEAAPTIVPAISEFLPSRLIYQEGGELAERIRAGGQVPAEVRESLIDDRGIRLNWVVTNPGELDALKLVARLENDQPLGELWFELKHSSTGEITLPEALQKVCQVTVQALICRDVPTQLSQVGKYQFELLAVTRQAGAAPKQGATPAPKAEPIVAKTELVTVRPLKPAIAQFQINGQPVQPKYLIPVIPGTSPPVITLGWQIVGGATTRAELLPVPGSVPLVGTARLPLNPQGSTVITLQATNPAGDTVSQSVQIETFNPNPADPAAAAAAAAAAALAGQNGEGANSPSQDAGRQGTGGTGGSGGTVDGGRIAPADTPPRFDR